MQTRSTWWAVRPWWKRVPPWWLSAVIATGPLVRILLGPRRAWLVAVDVALLAWAAAYVVVDLRRLRRSREVE